MTNPKISHKALRIALLENDIPSIPALAKELKVKAIRIYEILYGIGCHWESKQRLMEQISERLGIENPSDIFPEYSSSEKEVA